MGHLLQTTETQFQRTITQDAFVGHTLRPPPPDGTPSDPLDGMPSDPLGGTFLHHALDPKLSASPPLLPLMRINVYLNETLQEPEQCK